MVSKVKATDNIVSDVKKVINSLGGINAFINSGDRVFIKPNHVEIDRYFLWI